MGEPQVGVCSPWATVDDLCSPCDDYSADPILMADALAAASSILFRLSGRQFPGECEDVVRPCGGGGGRRVSGWRSDWGMCGCASVSCGCSSLSAITLSHLPIIEVTEVKVDGVVLDPARYRVDDHRWLVRLPDADGSRPGFPCCQRLDLASTEDDTFEVTFAAGRSPDAGGVMAAATLACELAKACSPEQFGGECQLPKRITTITRQQVTMAILDPQSLFDEQRTGIASIDLWLSSCNSAKLQRNATVRSVDVGRRVWRAGT